MFATKRLAKELQKAKQKLPPGIDLVKADDFREWQMDIRVLDTNPLYEGQIFRLSFIFTSQYPIEAPEVTFIYVPPIATSTPSLPAQFKTTTPPSSQPSLAARLNPFSSSNNTAATATKPAVVDLTSTSPSAAATTTNSNATGAVLDPPTSTPEPTIRRIPIHPHIYSNGIICLDLLGTAGWSPVQSVESVCMSIQSMLTGNTKNERPQGDEQFCASMGPRGPNGWSGSSGGAGMGGGGMNGGRRYRGLRDVRFAYDDDTV